MIIQNSLKSSLRKYMDIDTLLLFPFENYTRVAESPSITVGLRAFYALSVDIDDCYTLYIHAFQGLMTEIVLAGVDYLFFIEDYAHTISDFKGVDPIKI